MNRLMPARAYSAAGRAGQLLLLACVAIVAITHAAPSKNVSDVTGKPAFLQLSQLQRTLLTTKDGLPSQIYAIAEDRDGYLWLGGPTGLFRFDGLHFEPMFKGKIPREAITALFGDKYGNLWIGSLHGHVIRIRNGVAAAVERGLEKGTIMSFKQMADGTLWIVTSGGVYRLIDGTWRRAGPSEGIDAKNVWVTGTGSDGSYWIFASDAAYRLRPGAGQFERYRTDQGFAAMANLPATAVYPRGGVMADLIVDRYGALWVPINDKLLRLHADDGPDEKQLATENVKPAEDHTQIHVTADFSDNQGNVWIATSDGLEQFRATRFVPLVLPQSVFYPHLAVTRDDAFWVASNSATPAMQVGDTITVHTEIAGPAICMASDPDAGVWFVDATGILYYNHGQVSAIPTPPSLVKPALTEHPGQYCVDLQVAPDGSLWISMRDSGVSRWDGHAWATMARAGATSIAFEKTMTWLATYAGKLIAIDHGKTTVYTQQNGLDIGPLEKLYPGSSGLWITGTEGVMVKVGAQFHRLVGLHGEDFENVSDIVQLRNGDLWMASPRGVYHVSAAELPLALSTANHAVRYNTYDQADGIENAERIKVSAKGRLWVAMQQGVAWIDALHMQPAPAAPPVTIESLNDRDVRFPAAPVPTLEKGTRSVAITYTAATLAMPSQFHFRYLLKGIDDDWQEAGDRREAHYTNLGPGHYTFKVEASNADGVWAKQATRLSFQILPEFYQTWWFKALCIALVLAGFWWLHRLRVTRIYAQLNARTSERERMARDFHDTILQNFQSLLLHVQVAAQGISEDTARRKLDKALDVTEDALNKGREKIGQLRSLTEPLEDLSTDISQLADRLCIIYPMAFSMHVEGEPRSLNASAANDVHAIVRELVTNAFRHSQASTLHVELHYGRHELIISVIDDGCGTDAATKPGHWGLQGMQERARHVGGRLTFGTAPSGKGTLSLLKIPARFVYAGRRWFRRSLTHARRIV